ncbi:MAG: hypothetical protein IPO32_20535 [Crocinitomicaceae bacterium]|nr:hypothetical protein [Crocinitomicaceae bacterium]
MKSTDVDDVIYHGSTKSIWYGDSNSFYHYHAGDFISNNCQKVLPILREFNPVVALDNDNFLCVHSSGKLANYNIKKNKIEYINNPNLSILFFNSIVTELGNKHFLLESNDGFYYLEPTLLNYWNTKSRANELNFTLSDEFFGADVDDKFNIYGMDPV